LVSRWHIFLMLGPIFLFACQYRGATDSDSQPDNFTSLKSVSDFKPGSYRGFLPCADCEGISYQLDLYASNWYKESMVYQGKSEKPFIKSGTYLIDEAGLIELEKEGSGMKYFKTVDSLLLMLDRNKHEITGDLANHYLLKKVTSKINPASLNPLLEMYRQGIQFHAWGYEPHWVYYIYKNDTSEFKLMQETEVNFAVPTGKPQLAMDAPVKRYAGKSLNMELITTIKQTPCDTELDTNAHDFQVRITLLTGEDQQEEVFTGCGEYVPDFQLHDIWALEKLGDEPVTAADFQKEIPYIELNVTSGEYMGYGGCNRIRGKLIQHGAALYFQKGVSTMMACENSRENDFLTALARTKSYEVANLKLILRNPEGIQAVLRKVD